MDPINSVFGLCDAEVDGKQDGKLSEKEILENVDCLTMLDQLFGIKNTTIAEEFSLIDEDKDGFVTKIEARNAASNNLDRSKKKETTTPKPCQNFGGPYEVHKHNCSKCMKYRACKSAKDAGYIVKCNCDNGECQAVACNPLCGCNLCGTSLRYVCEKTP